METIIGLTIPFLGTALGASIVFMLRKGITERTNSAMLGFASGVMVAACFWSLLQPALEQVGEGIANTWPVLAGFAAGMCFLLLLDTVIPHQHVDDKRPEGPRSRLPRSIKMILAVALHNIPEGAIISVPLRNEGKSPGKAFVWGAASGLVEPIAALATMFILKDSTAAMPLLLALAAGAMLYVVVEELIPSSQKGKHSNIGTIGFALGFILMMLLDSCLG